jgi:hypothetical protein
LRIYFYNYTNSTSNILKNPSTRQQNYCKNVVIFPEYLQWLRTNIGVCKIWNEKWIAVIILNYLTFWVMCSSQILLDKWMQTVDKTRDYYIQRVCSIRSIFYCYYVWNLCDVHNICQQLTFLILSDMSLL